MEIKGVCVCVCEAIPFHSFLGKWKPRPFLMTGFVSPEVNREVRVFCLRIVTIVLLIKKNKNSLFTEGHKILFTLEKRKLSDGISILILLIRSPSLRKAYLHPQVRVFFPHLPWFTRLTQSTCYASTRPVPTLAPRWPTHAPVGNSVRLRSCPGAFTLPTATSHTPSQDGFLWGENFKDPLIVTTQFRWASKGLVPRNIRV